VIALRSALLLCAAVLWGAAGRVAAQEVVDGRVYAAVEGRRVTVRFAVPDSLVARATVRALEEAPALPGLPAGLPTGVTAVLAHSPAAFDAFTGGRVPEWRAGVAIPALGLMVIPAGEGTRVLGAEGRRVLRHEWAHLGLAQYLGPARIPRWFDEGYAQWVSGGWDASEAWRLRVSLAFGTVPSLDSLTLAWPRDRAGAGTAYLLAASAVAYVLG